jgi:hypothetical protein
MRRREEDFYRYSSIERQKWTLNLMVKMMTVLFITYFVLIFTPYVTGILEEYESILASEAEGMQRLPELKKQIQTIEKQLSALTTKSIENRLHVIEQAIKVGSIKPEEIATVQELKEDITILKTYMFRDPSELVELKQLQKNYQEIREDQDKLITEEDALREINFVKNLFYASMSFFGLFLAAMGASWWVISRKSKQESMKRKKP